MRKKRMQNMRINRIYTLVAVWLLVAAVCPAFAQTTPTIKGSVFGGGCMADVGTTAHTTATTTVTVNAATIEGNVYGGNDITGTVHPGTVTVGTVTGSVSAIVNITDKATTLNEVYGGSNGYYDYSAAGGTVTVKDKSGNVVRTYSGTSYSLPTTSVDGVIVNGGTSTGIYGGARNANATSGYVYFNTGTAGKVFGGNNYGGTIDNAALVINATKAPSSAPDVDTESAWSSAGTSWGIGEVYGGGNAADVTNSVSVTINNGYIKYVFGGNNLADMQNAVPDVFVKHGYIHTVYGGGNAGAMRGAAAGTIDYSLFISQLSLPTGIYNTMLPLFSGTDVMIDDPVASNTNPLRIGNVYGGCRAANVNNSTYVRVTRADYVGRVFGGCDIAGSVGLTPGTLTENISFTTYNSEGTHVSVKVPGTENTYYIGPKDGATYKTSHMVYASTYVLLNGGTVGNIYGGGNGNYSYSTSSETVTVKAVGAGSSDPVITTFNDKSVNMPFVTSSRLSIEGGTVTGNAYGGGNAAEIGHEFTEADKSRNGFKLESGLFVYYGKSYNVSDKLTRTSYLYIGKTDRSVEKKAPTISGKVYGGGCMANIYGTMDVIVKNGITLNTLFAGNDAAGTVAGQGRGSNQEHSGTGSLGTMLYDPARDESGNTPWLAYDNKTALTSDNANTYIRIEPGVNITNLYGGGNGDYTYNLNGGKVSIYTKGDSPSLVGIVTASDAAAAKPTMQGTWVDMKGNATYAYGGGNAADVGYANMYITGAAQITDAYGGGNAATVTGKASITVDCNAAEESSPYNVRNLFGGNNTADMYIVPSMNIMRGKIGNVYGGGNAGNMKGSDAGAFDLSDFLAQEPLPENIYATTTPLWAGTDVMIDSDYEKNDEGKPNGNPCGLRVDAVYGGCRAANVDNSTYIRLTHADYIGNVFGGCDVAGSVGMSPGKTTKDQTFTTYDKTQGKFVVVKDPKDSSKDYTIKAGTEMLYSSTYIFVTGGTVDGNIYGSGNGNYRYATDGNVTTAYDLKTNAEVASFDATRFSQPFAVSATLSIEGGTLKGNVYGGGYNAELGHVITQLDIDNADSDHKKDGKLIHYGNKYDVGETLSRTCYIYIGKTARSMSDNINLTKSVFGGGCLSNVYGVMDILVKSGATINALYAGNDVSGNVYGKGRGHVQQLGSEVGEDHIGTMLIDNEAKTYGVHHYDSYSGIELNENNAGTYIRVENGANITDLYGGGNGDYNYTDPSSGVVSIYKKGSTEAADLIGKVTASSAAAAKPIQGVSFLDVAGTVKNVYGGGNAANVEVSYVWVVRDAKVETAFGGGNSATVTESANIWIDCNAATSNATASSHNVWTLFGGNNLAEMSILPTIHLQCGSLGTVYGGGNAGKMSGHDAFALDFTAYKDNSCLTDGVVKKATVNGVLKTYLPMFSATEVLVDSPYKIESSKKVKLGTDPTAKDLAFACGLRINTVYGGCKAADVDNSTYTRITRADYVGNVYAGNDIAGTVGFNPGTVAAETELVAYEVLEGQTDATRYPTGVKYKSGDKMVNAGSYVFITGGTVNGNLFGGGNGAYYYSGGKAYPDADHTSESDVLATYTTLPTSAASFVGTEGGTVAGSVFGGGNQVAVGGVPTSTYDKTANPFYDCTHLFIGETARKKTDLVLASVFGGGNKAGVVRNTHLSVTSGKITQALYAGCNSEGTVSGDTKLDIHGGTIGHSKGTGAFGEVIFGGGYGAATSVTGNVYVSITGDATTHATVYGNIYGGGNAGPVNSDCENVTQTTISAGDIQGDIYGGGYGAVVNGKIDLTVTGITTLQASTDGKGARVFAANNSTASPKCTSCLTYGANSCDVSLFGGGNLADFDGNTKIIFTTGKVGYIYGGANMANVSGNTEVFILGGEICHDVYGGGKGAEDADNGNVAGNTNVYILDDRMKDGAYTLDSNGIPVKPTGWTEADRTSITIGSSGTGNVYGGGCNGNVAGQTNVVIGSDAK